MSSAKFNVIDNNVDGLLYINPIVSFKRFRIKNSSGGWVLHSPLQGDLWPFKIALKAYIDKTSKPPCDITRDSSVGIYSTKNTCNDDYLSRYILGTIYSWGRIIEHENGYRSEFAYIKSIESIPCSICCISIKDIDNSFYLDSPGCVAILCSSCYTTQYRYSKSLFGSIEKYPIRAVLESLVYSYGLECFLL